VKSFNTAVYLININMSFLSEKPMIVRIVPMIYALLGIFMFYMAAVNISDLEFAAISIIIGIFCLVCLYLVQIRKWYAWHVSMISFVIFGIYMAAVYLDSSDIIWLILLFMDAMIAVSWSIRFTRQYFDAAI